MSTESLDSQIHPRVILVSPAPSESEQLEMENQEKMTTTVNIVFPDDDSPPPPPPGGTVSATPSSKVIDRDIITNLLRSRPTIRRGKQDSRPGTSEYNRASPKYKSMQHQRPSSTGVKKVRRSSSFQFHPSTSSSSQIIIEDAEEGDPFDENEDTFIKGDIRRSTKRIKDRLRTYNVQQQNTMAAKEIRHSVFADFKYVKWPKIKSRLQVIRSWELWKGHMKEVEGHFGTAVVSYFIFLRWLFIMNIVIFAIWFSFVVVPNVVFISVAQPPGIPSLLSCAYDPMVRPFPNYTCTENLTSPSNTTPTIFYQTVTLNYTCNATNDTFSVRTCLYEDRTIGGVTLGVAYRESPDVISVSTSQPTDCMFENVTMPLAVQLCASDIEPHVEWYQYVIDFFLGEGIFNDTVLFHGRYSNSTVYVYNLPLAYMLLIIVVYTISVALLVYNLGQAYNESYLQFGKKRNINFCNKVFSSWDYNITDPNTAKLKKTQIKTELVEELADWEEKAKSLSRDELGKVIVIRIFTNLFTILLLGGGGVAIFYAAQLSFTTSSSSSVIALEGLVSPVIITAFNIILPFLFSFLAQFERFKTQSGEIKMTLFRTIVVRLASLIVLIGTLYIVIQCTQDVETLLSTASGGLSDNTCGVSTVNFTQILASVDSSRDCPVCWESYIGQEFYKLALTNFIITSASTLVVETARNVVSRIRWKGIGKKIGKGNFNIPKSILDLIYTQALLWLGFIFTPLSPAIILATTFMLFYVKKYSLIWNLVPSKRKTFRAARTNFAFIALMLTTLFMVIIVIGFAIASFRPSSNCGPFRGRRYMYSIITDLIAGIEDCSARAALEYFGSFGFLLPLFVFLVLVIYAQQVTIRSRKKRFNLIKEQLILEGANVTYIVGTLDEALNQVQKQPATETEEVDYLKYRMERVQSLSVSNTELLSEF